MISFPEGEAGGRDLSTETEFELSVKRQPAGQRPSERVCGRRASRNIKTHRHEGEFEVETNGETVRRLTHVRSWSSVIRRATQFRGSFSNIPPTPTPTPTPTPGVTPSPTPTPTPTPNPNNEVRLEARLAGAAINGLLPKGDAKFRSRSDGRRQLNVEVEKVNLPAGTVLNVLVDNANVGQIVLNSCLEQELELETEDGDIVPSVMLNSTVVVTDAQGRTILSGVFNTTRSGISGNDIDDSRFFVEQHYRDFLDREADDSGLTFWEHQITSCGADSACRERARINTSGAFFLSIEFQDTGYLLYRFNKASFGTMPRRNDFIVDLQAIAQGVVVGQVDWEAKLAANKTAAAERWANRPDFHARFDGMTNRQFINQLFANAGVTPGEQEREGLISRLDGGLETRGSAMRKVAENAVFSRQEKNPAFVLMQYFGYLHRNPDEGPDHDMSGFNFWLHKLDDNGGDFHRARMVKAFPGSRRDIVTASKW